MTIENLLDNLEYTRESYTLENTQGNNSSVVQNAITELKGYQESIVNLFGDSELGKEIRTLYESENDKLFSYVPVKKSIEVFKEYNDGMVKFIDELNGADPEVIKEYASNLKKASDSDKTFISTLFGGENNPVITEATITDALDNFDALLDLRESFSDYITKLENIPAANPEGIKLYSESVTLFAYESVKQVYSTFQDIQNSKRPNIPTAKNVMYRVF